MVYGDLLDVQCMHNSCTTHTLSKKVRIESLMAGCGQMGMPEARPPRLSQPLQHVARFTMRGRFLVTGCCGVFQKLTLPPVPLPVRPGTDGSVCPRFGSRCPLGSADFDRWRNRRAGALPGASAQARTPGHPRTDTSAPARTIPHRPPRARAPGDEPPRRMRRQVAVRVRPRSGHSCDWPPANLATAREPRMIAP